MNKIQKTHLLIWMFYTIYYLISYTVIYGKTLNILLISYVVFINLTFAITFYGCILIIFPRYLERKHYIPLILCSLFVVLFSAIFRILTFKYIFPIVFLNAEKQELNQAELLGMFWNTQIYVFYALGYSFAQRVIQQQIEIGKEKDHNALLEKEKAQADYTFLRSQINPHFMFNTLALIYEGVRKVNEGVGDTLIQFSDMMRYSTSKSMLQDEVGLKEELQFVNDFLDIQKKRFRNALLIDYNKEGNIQSQRIVPMVIFTFVENAIKHGMNDDPEFPLFIRESLIKDRFTFTVHNRKNPKPHGFDTGETGISLLSLKKRLDAVYKNGGYCLTIDDLEDEFIVNFIVNFNEVKNKK